MNQDEAFKKIREDAINQIWAPIEAKYLLAVLIHRIDEAVKLRELVELGPLRGTLL